jgi:hypothetical protein
MLRRTLGAILLGTLLAPAAAPRLARAACDDPVLAEAVRQQIASTCTCTAATNHGQYVSCVVRELRQAVANGLPRNCKGVVTRCAARSTCGKKAGFVTCCRLQPGLCRQGLCQDGVTSCTLPEECPLRPQCNVKSTPELCIAAGGSPGAGSCCDAVCSVPTP